MALLVNSYYQYFVCSI